MQERAARAAGLLDAVVFGSAYVANPDLVERFAKDAPINVMNPATLYTPGPAGYTDYPRDDAAAA